MKFVQKSLVVLLLIIPFSLATAVTISKEYKDPKVGDVLVVNKPSAEHFQHIYFPEPSEIRNKTGNVDYKVVFGMEAKITKVERNGDEVIVILKPLYGKKFFGHWRSIRANYSLAMEAGELNISY